MGGYGLVSSSSRYDVVAGSSEKGIETWDFKKCTEFHK